MASSAEATLTSLATELVAEAEEDAGGPPGSRRAAFPTSSPPRSPQSPEPAAEPAADPTERAESLVREARADVRRARADVSAGLAKLSEEKQRWAHDSDLPEDMRVVPEVTVPEAPAAAQLVASGRVAGGLGAAALLPAAADRLKIARLEAENAALRARLDAVLRPGRQPQTYWGSERQTAPADAAHSAEPAARGFEERRAHRSPSPIQEDLQQQLHTQIAITKRLERDMALYREALIEKERRLQELTLRLQMSTTTPEVSTVYL